MTPASTRLARAIEHTLLRPEATPGNVDRLCAEALEHGFHAVCVQSSYVRRAASALAGTSTGVVSIAGFPLGAAATAAKRDEARHAIDDGADEIDMVLHLGYLIDGDGRAVRDDIEAVARAVHGDGKHRVLKVILETAALTDDQIVLACRCCAEGEADFVKTSTGFHPAGGATVEAVRRLRRLAAPMGVKASGGIRSATAALALLDAGADRIGTSSGVAIMTGVR